MHRLRQLANSASTLKRSATWLTITGAFWAFCSNVTIIAEELETIAASPKLGPTVLFSPTPTADEIDSWIAELSHDEFAVRQSAANRLLAAGVAARSRLLEVAESPDPETRAAARRLVSLIDQSEFQRRLEAFAADVDGRRGLSLPGWEQYRELIGGDPAARALFVEMQRNDASLFAAAFGSSGQRIEPLWEERLVRLISWQALSANRDKGPPLGSCAAMLFLGSVGKFEISDQAAVTLDGLIQRSPLRESLQGGTTQDVVRRIVASWIVHCPNKNEVILDRRLALASVLDLKETLPLALAVIGGDPRYAGVRPYIRATAALLVGQFGTPDHVDQLEPLLDDAGVCSQAQLRLPGAPDRTALTVQVRDAALVALLQLTGQQPADYGYLHARLQPQRMFQLQSLHPPSDEQRTKALAKWRAWREKQLGRESKVNAGKLEE
jgi:hypothetical protein